MNNSKTDEIIRFIDLQFTLISIDDLKLAKALIERNPSIIKDYPSLDALIKSLNRVIAEVSDNR